jgi:hypothetical protein
MIVPDPGTASMSKFVSPEYKARCIEWALQTQPEFTVAEPNKKIGGADGVLEAAKKYYAYVYGDGQ